MRGAEGRRGVPCGVSMRTDSPAETSGGIAMHIHTCGMSPGSGAAIAIAPPGAVSCATSCASAARTARRVHSRSCDGEGRGDMGGVGAMAAVARG